MDIKQQLTKIVCDHLGVGIDQDSYNKTYNSIWQNPRKRSEGGLRLTDEGYSLFKEKLEMKSYEIEFPKELTITNQVMLWLDRFIDGPYYFNKKSIIVFKEKTAVQLILFSGDIQKFGLAKAMNTAYQ